VVLAATVVAAIAGHRRAAFAKALAHHLTDPTKLIVFEGVP